ncbi:unnamed protein product [Timema podura]|uniref:Uncharacterized protein n=1 Tax=Timema podura TaxID=61482 RepID=A0ABN7PDT1_TIMPD|nr:unnamed protein product [Timema podura]
MVSCRASWYPSPPLLPQPISDVRQPGGRGEEPDLPEISLTTMMQNDFKALDPVECKSKTYFVGWWAGGRKAWRGFTTNQSIIPCQLEQMDHGNRRWR